MHQWLFLGVRLLFVSGGYCVLSHSTAAGEGKMDKQPATGARPQGRARWTNSQQQEHGCRGGQDGQTASNRCTAAGEGKMDKQPATGAQPQGRARWTNS